jgi:hypothetical protein
MTGALPATGPSSNHAVQARPYAGVPFRRRADISSFSGSGGCTTVPALLHIAVFLFFAGLADILFSIDGAVGRVILGLICFLGGIYVLLTSDCPYRTPCSRDTLKWWFHVVFTVPALRGIYCSQFLLRSEMFEPAYAFCSSLLWTMSDAMRSLQEGIDRRVLQ